MSGVDVSILTLGGALNFKSKQILLGQALKMGVTCWDSSHNYIGGNSEKGIGKYFNKFPDDRKKVFLETKTGQSDPDNRTQHLYDSLQWMKTAYIDLFLIQAVSNVSKEMSKNIQAWAEGNKSRGKIRFLGFSTEQAKLKSVWENPAIASICSHMPNLTLLQANVAAAINKTALSFNEKQLMAQYAKQTSSGYCTGCAEKFEEAIVHAVPISDIMRYLMYYCNYGEPQQAIRLFNDLLFDTRTRIAQVNYSKAEQCCPQKMPIAQLMRKAVAKLAC